MSDLPKQYEPKPAQAKWFAFWEQHGYFNAEPQPPVSEGGKPAHTIMIPLPNVTGALHMGHALNGTCQDLITRWRRMQGYEALWMPGTDHAGIATQAVVERRMLEEEGLTRHDIGREALVERIWKWKAAYEKRIIGQLKQIGASCDWRRTRFTLDEVCSRAVRRTFFKMFRDGLIYRGKRLVNWDTFLQTAVADDEVFEEDIDGHFWTFRYPVVDDAGQETGEFIRFSTTRPETMLGDTAVCVHPTDERYTQLVGKQVRIPLNGRLIPIIADGLLADKELGTGAVKVTPGHDPNDYACYARKLGQPDEIAIIDLLNLDGTVNAAAKDSGFGIQDSGSFSGEPKATLGAKYVGIDRLKVRDMVVEDMTALGLFEAVEDRKIPLKHSDRSKTPIEPLRSDQWFLKMDDHADGRPGLAQSALDAVNDNRVRFYPSRYAKTYLDWLGEKRDWCISRQLWWGHRIPVWTIAINVKHIEKWIPHFSKGATPASVTMIELRKVLWDQGFDDDEDVCTITLSDDGKSILCCALSEDVDVVFENIAAEIARRKSGKDMLSRFELAATYCDSCERDLDVLDTWFSSALWPHATLGWPDMEHNPPLDGAECAKQRAGGFSPPVSATDRRAEPPGSPGAVADGSPLNAPLTTHHSPSTKLQTPGNAVLNTFYPGSVLVTSRDIITLWVARMVLTGLYNMRDDPRVTSGQMDARDMVPFHHVCVHPKILDGFGQTMSKSKGNGVDPMDLIDKYGTDAVRFTIASFAGETQDVRLPVGYECPHCGTVIPQTLEHQKLIPAGGAKPRLKCPNSKCSQESQFTSAWFDPDPGEPVARIVSERFEYGRNFCNKFWNAARFAIMNLEGYTPAPVAADQLRMEDRWILSRLARVNSEVDQYLSRYQFDAATRTIREFAWNEFCDWYLEMIKPRLRREGSEVRGQRSEDERVAGAQRSPGDDERAVAQRVLLAVLDTLVRLLQPFTPFICEELWQRLNEIAPERSLPEIAGSKVKNPNLQFAICNLQFAILRPARTEPSAIIAAWPSLSPTLRDDALETRFNRLQDTIVAVRNVRAVYNIPPATPLQLMVRAPAEVAGDLQDVAAQFDNLAKAVLAAAGAEVVRPPASASFSLGDADGYIPLEGIIDRKAELDRQTKAAEQLKKHIAGNEGKLKNEAFVGKAPPEVVAGVRDQLESLKKQLASAEEIIRDLSAG